MIDQNLVHVRPIPVNNVVVLEELLNVIHLLGELALHKLTVVFLTRVRTVSMVGDFFSVCVGALHAQVIQALLVLSDGDFVPAVFHVFIFASPVRLVH